MRHAESAGPTVSEVSFGTKGGCNEGHRGAPYGARTTDCRKADTFGVFRRAYGFYEEILVTDFLCISTF